MKITSDLLTSKQPQQDQLALPIAKVVQPEKSYAAEEVSKSDPHPELYVVRSRRYAEAMGWKMVDTVQEAVSMRRKGIKAISIREADTAARTAMPIDNKLVEAAIMESANSVCVLLLEDTAGAPNSVFELRKYYNRGLAYFKSDKPKTDSPAKVAKDKERVAKTLAMLEFANVPAWPEEVKDGFPLEMCKPDFMSWDKYNQRLIAGGQSNHDFDQFNKEYVYNDTEGNQIDTTNEAAGSDPA